MPSPRCMKPRQACLSFCCEWQAGLVDKTTIATGYATRSHAGRPRGQRS